MSLYIYIYLSSGFGTWVLASNPFKDIEIMPSSEDHGVLFLRGSWGQLLPPRGLTNQKTPPVKS